MAQHSAFYGGPNPRRRQRLNWGLIAAIAPFAFIVASNFARGYIAIRQGDMVNGWWMLGSAIATVLLLIILGALALARRHLARRRSGRAARPATARRRTSL